MKKGLVLFTIFLMLVPFVAAYGVTFYNPAWDPQDGKVYDVIDADTPYVFNVKTLDIAITQITFTINITAKNGGLTVYHLNSMPDNLPEISENESYEFNELKYSGFAAFNTKSFIYEFKVAKGWLENMTVSRDIIALHSYNPRLDVWETLPTKITDDDDSFVYYSSESTGVHYLFIGKAQSGEKAESDLVQEVQVEDDDGFTEIEDKLIGVDINSSITPVDISTDVVTPVSQPAPIPGLYEEPVVEDEENGSYLLIGLIVLAIIFIFLIVYVVSGRRKGGYSVDRELNSYIKESLKRGKTKAEIKTRLLEVGWHHERVEKAVSKHKDIIKAKPKQDIKSEPKQEQEVKYEGNMSLAEAKAYAERHKKLLAAKKNISKHTKKLAKTHVKAKKK